MLRVIASKSAGAAANYFDESLSKEDYYSKDAVAAKWHGLAAENLGLRGEVKVEDFKALLNNLHPETGKKLTPRQNAAGERIPGWDFNFHVPKSVSVLHALTGDDAFQKVLRESVAETMGEIEKLVSTRIRKGGQQDDRLTSNFVWAEFIHTTARPTKEAGGIPDPHLHIHAYCMNLTVDAVEDRWKAAKIRDIVSQAPHFQALFHSKLAAKIEELGFATVRTKQGWEIFGIHGRSLLEKFSHRTAEVEAKAAELGLTDAKQKDSLGARTRAGKRKGMSDEQLRKAWDARLTPEERQAIADTYAKRPPGEPPRRLTAAEVLDYAEGLLFETNSVAKLSNLRMAALKVGVGSVTQLQINQEIARRGYIEKNVDGHDLVTTAGIVIEEAGMIQMVRDGRAKLAPIAHGKIRFNREFLSEEQREAVKHLLTSTDQVLGLRGKAGVGKTTLLQEVRDHVEASGLRLFAFAPSAMASRGVLRDEGFVGANTVQWLLTNKDLQKKIRGNVILIDEAGTIGVRDLAKIMELAGKSTRVILAGDTSQHAPVSRGDALRLLETYAGLTVATVSEIRRQEKAEYRKVVEALSKGDLGSAFARLDDLGAIRTIPSAPARYAKLAEDFANITKETGAAPLVISPTHAEGALVTDAIRSRLRDDGKLGADTSVVQYRAFRWSDAEKAMPEIYEPGMMVQFHQNAKGVGRGSKLIVSEVDLSLNVWVTDQGGERHKLDLNQAPRFRVFEVGAIKVARGDTLKITNGGKAEDGRRLDSGMMRSVKRVGKDGKIVLDNGLVLPPGFGHLSHGYCHTSHSSQGRSVKNVLIAHSSDSFGAASKEGFYVSTSRGKVGIRLYTDSRAELLKAVGKWSRRMAALELADVGKGFFMEGGLTGKEWTERIAAESAKRLKNVKGHAERINAERKLQPKEQIKLYTKYVENRRANSGPDGKSRSKGHPQAQKQKRRFSHGRTLPKTVLMRESLEDRQKAKEEKARAAEKGKGKKAASADKSLKKSPSFASARAAKIGKGLKAMKSHLGAVLKSRPATEEKKDRSPSIGMGKVRTTLGKLNSKLRQKAQVQKKATEAPKPKPPTPTITRRR